jgi:hypothetical protein
MLEDLKGASAADRVDVFKNTPIVFEWTECAPYIKNRNKTGMCLVETLSLKHDDDDIDGLFIDIKEFLESLRR